MRKAAIALTHGIREEQGGQVEGHDAALGGDGQPHQLVRQAHVVQVQVVFLRFRSTRLGLPLQRTS